MLHLKTVEELEKQDFNQIYLELIKMRFLASIHFTKKNIYHISVNQPNALIEFTDKENDNMKKTLDYLYGNEEKIEIQKNSILKSIDLLEKGLDNIENISFNYLLIYKGIYNNILIISNSPYIKEERFDLWYSKLYHTGKGKIY